MKVQVELLTEAGGDYADPNKKHGAAIVLVNGRQCKKYKHINDDQWGIYYNENWKEDAETLAKSLVVDNFIKKLPADVSVKDAIIFYIDAAFPYFK